MVGFRCLATSFGPSIYCQAGLNILSLFFLNVAEQGREFLISLCSERSYLGNDLVHDQISTGCGGSGNFSGLSVCSGEFDSLCLGEVEGREFKARPG